MKYAYADPPYLGCCRLYGHDHRGIPNPVQAVFEPVCWDELGAYRDLIHGLSEWYPDGWALSCSTTSLKQLLPLCPDDVRIGAWVKPFAIFKPNVNPGYCWEPVIFRGGRRHRDRSEPTIRDYVTANITLEKGLTGVKPDQFNQWVIDMLGYVEGDELVDLFPGKSGMARVLAQGRLV